MLLPSYYAQNYAGIRNWLKPIYLLTSIELVQLTHKNVTYTNNMKHGLLSTIGYFDIHGIQYHDTVLMSNQCFNILLGYCLGISCVHFNA